MKINIDIANIDIDIANINLFLQLFDWYPCSKDMSCYAYRSDNRDDNQPLPDGSYTGVDDLMMQCPRFANQGCFKADYKLAEDGTEVFPTGFHKGCSMFELGDRETECQGEFHFRWFNISISRIGKVALIPVISNRLK